MDLLAFYKKLLLTKDPAPSKVTVKNYLSDLRAFISWYETKTNSLFHPDRVTFSDIREYQGLDTISPRSRKRYLSSLKKFYSLLLKNELTSNNPFEELSNNQKMEKKASDPWLIQDFRDYLYESGSSHHTIKNYIIDIQNFTAWCEKSYPLSALKNNRFSVITPIGLEEYKQRLASVRNFSPRSINRKLSSIRKYVTYLQVKNLITTPTLLPKNIEPENIGQTIKLIDLKQYEEEPKVYSTIAPVRLTQKILSPYGILQDKIADRIVARIQASNFESFNKASKILSQEIALHPEIVPTNIPKEFFAPTQSMVASMPFKKRVIHHARFSRPQWYKKYHSLTFSHYLHLGILFLYTSVVGFAVYKTVITAPAQPALASISQKSLYFQGNLRDKKGMPITDPTQVTFGIYTSPLAKEMLVWSETQKVLPDGKGHIRAMVGKNNPIPAALFEQYSSLYLGVKIGQQEELVPRERLAASSFSQDSQSLAGMSVITDSSSNKNVVLALDSSGNLSIGGNANPIFQAIGGVFTLKGQALSLATNTGSDGNIQLSPDGQGQIDLQGGVINSSANGVIPGAVEVNDQFAVNATESAKAAAIINNNSFGGDLFTASSSGTTRFVIDTYGHVGINNANPLYELDVKGNARVTGATILNSITYTWPANYGSKGSVLSNNGTGTLSWIDASELSPFTQKGGILSLSSNNTAFQITNASSSAKFLIQGLDKDVANLYFRGDITLQGGQRAIGTENYNALSLGSPSTGTVFLSPGGNTSLAAYQNGTIGINVENPAAVLDIAGKINTNSVLGLSGNTIAPVLAISNTGSGSLITATSAGQARFEVKNNGDVVVGNNGTGKITAGTIDPLYTIDGQKFSTYAPSMPGVKEEVAGRATLTYHPELKMYAYSLDLNNLQKGSDLWLFSRIIDSNISYLSALLTPDSQAMVWYKKDESSRTITFLSDEPVNVSYRLTAPRYDHAQWPNTSSESASGLTVPPPPTQITPAGSSLTSNFISFRISQTGTDLALIDSLGHVIQKAGNFSRVLAARIEAGAISATTISTDALIINGKNLSDYIGSTLSSVIATQKIVSPLAQVNTIETNFISPLAQDSSISASLTDSSFTIHNGTTASSSAVAKIDNKGNAQFSGSLTAATASFSGSLQTQDATISGTLNARTIVADTIQGLDSKVASAAASYLQNQQKDQSYQSVNTFARIPQESLPTLNQALNSSYMDVASLSAQFATFENGLLSLGPSTFGDLSVTGSMTVGTNLRISNNAIDVIGQDLQVQPLQQGGISFLSGKIRIDETGKVEFSQDAHFSKNVQVDGTLMAGIISPVPEKDLVFSLGQKIAGGTQSIKIQDANGNNTLQFAASGDIISSGSAVFAKDLVASGAAYLSKLNIFSQKAYAISDTTAAATGSAGTATLNAYQRELTIQDPLVTKNSLIYITPVGDTQNQVVSLLRQVPGASFTVGIGQAISNDISFNWIIVN